MHTGRTLPRLGLAAGLWLAASGAWAQYKIVGPDGSVTYTDRPPASTTSAAAKVTALKGGAVPLQPAPVGVAALPTELRAVAARFPVTLYTGADCQPCDTARRLLQQRGIPYAERSIVTEDDAAALQRLTQGRTVPTLTVGQQVQRGLLDTEWQQLFDLAGYPRESRLPRDWQPRPATPLVQRAEVSPQQAVAPAAAPVRVEPASPEPEADGDGPKIRF